MHRQNSLSVIAVLAVAGLVTLWCATGSAAVLYHENGGTGRVVGEAEVFTSRADLGNGTGYRVVPTESAAVPTMFSGVRGGEYVQCLPDGGGVGGPNNPPSIEYQMSIQTVGTYQLYLRWDGFDGGSDSIFADIVELKDGTGGSIADWYEFAHGGDSNFATTPWDGSGGVEVNNAGGTPKVSALWSISTPGTYTLRISTREDGVAVDAWVFQETTLWPDAPTGTGPGVPEPSSLVMLLGLGGVGLLGYFWRRRRR